MTCPSAADGIDHSGGWRRVRTLCNSLDDIADQNLFANISRLFLVCVLLADKLLDPGLWVIACLLIRSVYWFFCLLILVASIRNVSEPSSRFIFWKCYIFKMINSIKIYMHEAFLYFLKEMPSICSLIKQHFIIFFYIKDLNKLNKNIYLR